MIAPLYRGSVKNVLGPAGQNGDQVLFDYTDAYSVFDWGKMPDSLPRKGEALAILAAHWFESIQRPETWREFSRAPEALEVRKSNPFGSAFNELGEKLQGEGLRTHYLGVVPATEYQRIQNTEKATIAALPLDRLTAPTKYLAVQHVSVVKPNLANLLGREVPDYLPTRGAPAPRLIPLEVVFRFACPEGSSLLERARRDPEYMASIGFGKVNATPGARWEFPVLEMFTKLETADRPVGFGEALAISGLSSDQLQEMLLKTAWVAAFLKSSCSKAGLELADGKLEWALSEKGECFLVDAVGPDELRLLKNGVQLSKEFLRGYYRESSWYQSVKRAKGVAQVRGVSDWKKGVTEQPQPLPQNYRETAAHLYLALTNSITGKNWFPEAWPLGQVVESLKKLGG